MPPPARMMPIVGMSRTRGHPGVLLLAAGAVAAPARSPAHLALALRAASRFCRSAMTLDAARMKAARCRTLLLMDAPLPCPGACSFGPHGCKISPRPSSSRKGQCDRTGRCRSTCCSSPSPHLTGCLARIRVRGGGSRSGRWARLARPQLAQPSRLPLLLLLRALLAPALPERPLLAPRPWPSSGFDGCAPLCSRGGCVEQLLVEMRAEQVLLSWWCVPTRLGVCGAER